MWQSSTNDFVRKTVRFVEINKNSVDTVEAFCNKERSRCSKSNIHSTEQNDCCTIEFVRLSTVPTVTREDAALIINAVGN